MLLWHRASVSVGRTNIVLKTLHVKTICPTLACTKPTLDNPRIHNLFDPHQSCRPLPFLLSTVVALMVLEGSHLLIKHLIQMRVNHGRCARSGVVPAVRAVALKARQHCPIVD